MFGSVRALSASAVPFEEAYDLLAGVLAGHVIALLHQVGQFLLVAFGFDQFIQGQLVPNDQGEAGQFAPVLLDDFGKELLMRGAPEVTALGRLRGQSGIVLMSACQSWRSQSVRYSAYAGLRTDAMAFRR